ncbi:MAG: aldehyde dehydrogenase family protein, partial [candidate division Zixibacteria bacterium]|nr:aldehyde dehydrogenase family protein [candidate division Zixibacteria bacterium]
MKAINPANNKLIKEYTEHTESEVEQIVEKAHQEFLKWRETSFEHRSKLMFKTAETLRRNIDEYAEMMTLEMGKIITESRA